MLFNYFVIELNKILIYLMNENNISHNYSQHWKVFKQVSEVFILVPSLLGLKGNLEMTLASRLSTQVSLMLLITIDYLS